MTCEGCAKRRETIKRFANRIFRKGGRFMDFTTWAAKHDFWKQGTMEAFRPVFAQLLRSGMHVNQVNDMLDRVVGAMKSEYGE